MRKLIAVVDDEADILEVVSYILESEGYKVEKFPDVKSFYAFIEKQTPHLLLLDIMLPDVGGFEVCKHLKAQEKYADIPIIM